MTTQQIVAALTKSAKPGTLLDVLTSAAGGVAANGDKRAIADCVALWRKSGGPAPRD